MALSKIQSGLITDDAVNSNAIADGSIDHSKMASGAKIGYIQSKHTGIDANQSVTGDTDDQPFSNSGGSECVCDMGTPNSASSTYVIKGDAQAHFDGADQTNVESGGGGALGIQRKIGTGSWTTIKDHGRWSQFTEQNTDLNWRLYVYHRDHPNTTEQVQYRLVYSTHRAGIDWRRMPSGSYGSNTNLYVEEYDTGESS